MKYKVALSLIVLLLIPITLSVAQPTLAGAPSSIQPPAKMEIDDSVNMTVDARGIIHVKEELKATASAFKKLTALFPTPFMMKRLLESDKQQAHMENISIKYDTLNNRVIATYDLLGMAVKRMGSWQILIEKNAKLTAKTGKTYIFSYMTPISNGELVTVLSINLPESATNAKIKQDQDYKKLVYDMPSPAMTGNLAIYGAIGILAILLILNLVLKDGLLGLAKKGRERGELKAPS